MEMQLSTKNFRIRYSPRERSMFELLRKLGATRHEVSAQDVLDACYTDEVPFHARQIVNNVVSSLSKKMQVNGEPIELIKSPQRGPYPITLRIAWKGRQR